MRFRVEELFLRNVKVSYSVFVIVILMQLSVN